jgi:ABC-type bacteriocin/lantibiotic exporter with double-glycine peptidase domain
MNQKKNLNLIGFFLILNVLNFPFWYSFIIVRGRQDAFQDNSSSIEVDYLPQRTSLFCGPACVRMILYMVQGRAATQFVLKDELLFREGLGTRNINMKNPFQNRDIEIVDVGCYSDLKHLKNSINKRQYSIINIKFDSNTNFGHYVVVTGYNKTGIFINDPWPKKWGEHCARETGENAYISNESLKELWSYRKFWVLTIAGPESVHDGSFELIDAKR